MIKAFLVEDQADIRQTLIEGMEETVPLQFIGQASDEPGALRWLARHEGDWDLAIVDLFLRDGSGFGVLKACQRRAPRQKVVVLTSYTDERVLQHCRDMGADAVFDKSVEVHKLVEFSLDLCEDLSAMTPTGLITESQPMPLDTSTMALEALRRPRLEPHADAPTLRDIHREQAGGGNANTQSPGQRHAHFFATQPPSTHRQNEPDHLAARNAALGLTPTGAAPAPGVANAPAASRWFTRDRASTVKKTG